VSYGLEARRAGDHTWHGTSAPHGLSNAVELEEHTTGRGEPPLPESHSPSEWTEKSSKFLICSVLSKLACVHRDERRLTEARLTEKLTDS